MYHKSYRQFKNQKKSNTTVYRWEDSTCCKYHIKHCIFLNLTNTYYSVADKIALDAADVLYKVSPFYIMQQQLIRSAV